MSENKVRPSHLGLPALLVASLLVVCSLLSLAQSHSVSAYPANCITEACRSAYDQAEAAAAAATEAANNAQTLEGEIARRDAEIANLEAQIAANQAIADDLAAQISENEVKLNLQQTALAELLVDMHFEDQPDAILLLASSSSIGELAERQARQDNAKAQIAASATAVRELKAKLEAQKADVDALIAGAESSRAEVAAMRAEQAALKAKYENDAEAYARDQEAALAVMRENLTSFQGGTIISGIDSYPYRAQCPGINWYYTGNTWSGAYGGLFCECTSYAGWKAYETFGVSIASWGNAMYWKNNGVTSKTAYDARIGGYRTFRVDKTPAPLTVGVDVYCNGTCTATGHVYWVEAVHADGTLRISEYNNAGSSPTGQRATFGAQDNFSYNYADTWFIHFD